MVEAVGAILKQKAAPIHYKAEELGEIREQIKTKKRAGPAEVLRQAFGNESSRMAFVEDGYIGLIDWKEQTKELFKDCPDKPYHKIYYTKKAVANAFKEFSKRKLHMLDKGLPIDIRINGLVAEEAIKEWFMARYQGMVKEKLVTNYTKYCDHDFIIEVNGKAWKIDVKSLQSKKGWNIGKGNGAKDDVIYLFTSPADKKTKTILMVGWQYGSKLKRVEGRILGRHMLHIHLLIGRLSYLNKNTWIK